MARTSRKHRAKTVQVFIVSYFTVGAAKTSSFIRLTRESAERCAEDLRESFRRFPSHNPAIHIDRTERAFDYLGDDVWQVREE